MEDKQPTQEELIQFYEEKSKLLEARLKYQKLDTEIAELITRKFESMAKLAYLQHKTEEKKEDGDKSTSS